MADVELDVTFDKNGKITSMKVPTIQHMSMEEIIEHAGVKGMKWGVKKSVSTSVGKAKQKIATNKASSKREKSWQGQYKKRGSMSNAQLKTKIERLRLENEFNRLATEANPPRIKKAKMYMDIVSKLAVSSTGKTLAKKIAKNVAKGAATAAVI